MSNNALSTTTNNGKTLLSLLQGYPSHLVSQLYFSGEVPSGSLSDTFYQLSDHDVWRAFRTRQPASGRARRAEEPLHSSSVRQRKATSFVRLLRELVWRWAPRDQQELDRWLDAVGPEVVLFVAGDSLFAYREVHRLLDRTGAGLLVYLTDDYIIERAGDTPLGRFRTKLVRKHVREMLGRACSLLTISEQMRSAYRSMLGWDSAVIVNSPDIREVPPPTTPPDPNRPVIFAYVGGLHLGRDEVLHRIGREIARLNRAFGASKAYLHVYSAQPLTDHTRSLLDVADGCLFKGALDADGVAEVLASADVLVHVESFDAKNADSTLLSLSTKIPEYLSQAKCILAVGPSHIASMQTLAPVAESVTAREDLAKAVTRLISDPGWRADLSQRTRALYERDFMPDMIRARLLAAIRGCRPWPL